MTEINLLFEEYIARRLRGILDGITKLRNQYLPMVISKQPFDIFIIFINYRRNGGFYPAMLLFTLLEAEHRIPFLDLECLRNGRLDEKNYEAMEHCSAVLFILTKGCFCGCVNPASQEKDSLPWEIMKALTLKQTRHIKIIPAMINRFQFPENMPQRSTFLMRTSSPFRDEIFVRL